MYFDPLSIPHPSRAYRSTDHRRATSFAAAPTVVQREKSEEASWQLQRSQYRR